MDKYNEHRECQAIRNGRLAFPSTMRMMKGDPLHDASVAKQSCTLHDFHSALRARDPLGLGFERSADLLLHLIWRLLDWDPLTRISPHDALEHPYFTSNNDLFKCVPNQTVLALMIDVVD